MSFGLCHALARFMYLMNTVMRPFIDKFILVFLDNAFDDDTFRSGGTGPAFGLQNTRIGFIGGLGVSGFFGIMPDPRTAGIRTAFRFGG